MTWTASPSTLQFGAPVGTAPAAPRVAVRLTHTAPAAARAAVRLTRTGAGLPRAAVRLTRRGRLLVLLALVAVVLLAFTLGRSASSQAASSGAPTTPYAQTTVHEGESLWAVAKRVAPGHDPRAVVQEIRELNHLDNAAVRTGQQLLLPRNA